MRTFTQALTGSWKELLPEQTKRHGTIDACWIKAFHTNNRCTGDTAGYLLCFRKENRRQNMILYLLLDAVDPNINKRQMVEKSKTNSKVWQLTPLYKDESGHMIFVLASK